MFAVLSLVSRAEELVLLKQRTVEQAMWKVGPGGVARPVSLSMSPSLGLVFVGTRPRYPVEPFPGKFDTDVVNVSGR